MIDDESAKKEGAEGRSSPLFLRGGGVERLGGISDEVEVGPMLVGEEAGSLEGKLDLFFSCS
jgi:hypothetical protein